MNLHGLPHRLLRPACLPFHHPGWQVSVYRIEVRRVRLAGAGLAGTRPVAAKLALTIVGRVPRSAAIASLRPSTDARGALSDVEGRGPATFVMINSSTGPRDDARELMARRAGTRWTAILACRAARV